jgi:L-ribulose-5-phosphate 4-epimerase
MTAKQIEGEYEKNTGLAIVEAFNKRRVKPEDVPAVLVHRHGPFTWGKNAEDSVHNAAVLEEVAMMAWHTLSLTPYATLSKALQDKHYKRKHGAGAYYGQAEDKKVQGE